MDYQFYHSLEGIPIAQFSMGHEVIGYWLNEEIKGDLSLIKQIDRATADPFVTWQLLGHEYSLFIADHEVTVKANQLAFGCDECTIETLNYYDAESIAYCGLDDFLIMLAHYRAFISTTNDNG